MLKLLQEIEALKSQQERIDADLQRKWKEFGQSVREYRRQKNLTLEAVGEQVGLVRSQMSYLETGDRTWDFDTAMRVVEVLK